MMTKPETPQAKNKKPAEKPAPFASHEGDKQIVNGIGDTADEEKERHSSKEHNHDSRTKE